ncbi:MAG: glycerophosphodiester phosphodiesterase [Burkholderiaceae bacterium]
MDAWPYPLWFAHRGAGKLAPENTLAAFRLGASHGQTAFECDVKLSTDGVPFLLHDNTLERTTSGAGIAGERLWSELSQLDAGGWHGPAYAGESIPALAAVARWCLANGHLLDLEIKPTPGAETRTGQVVGTEVARLWAGAETTPLLSSFRPEALAGARETAPQLRRALLVDGLWPGWFEVATELGCVAVISNQRCMDAALVARLHGARLRALVYTVNDAARAQALVELGVDGIVTDAVDRFSPAGGIGTSPAGGIGR